jgi:NADPH:quinone reductase-like Zn-dependent oxidoreductase
MIAENRRSLSGFDMLGFNDATTRIRLHTGQPGSIESLQYHQVPAGPEYLDDGCVEIQVIAAGVNFKDVTIILGLILGNEYTRGEEGSSIVMRVAPDVTIAKPGERVAFFDHGAFANVIITSSKLVITIPDSLSFVEAATIPCVFMTSLHCLFNLANVQRGDRVLIHSAAGGVGIAAIQLCRYVGATVSSHYNKPAVHYLALLTLS